MIAGLYVITIASIFIKYRYSNIVFKIIIIVSMCMFLSTLILNKMQLTGKYVDLYFKITQFGNPFKYVYGLFVYWVLNKFDFIGFKIYSLLFYYMEYGTPVVISLCVLENRESRNHDSETHGSKKMERNCNDFKTMG